VQFLFFGGEAVDVKLIAELRFRSGRRRRFDQFERFWLGMKLELRGCGLLNDRCARNWGGLPGLRHWLRRHWPLWCRRRLGSNSADQVSELIFER